MTREEAIKHIRYRIDTASTIVGTGEDGKAFEDLELAITDMEKQIPNKVRELDEAKNLYVAVCTKCGYLVYRNQRYCDGCGHRLLWEV